jgi:hypothetical protein
LLNMIVYFYIARIVAIDEIAVIDLPERHKGGNGQEKGNHDDLLILRHTGDDPEKHG